MHFTCFYTTLAMLPVRFHKRAAASHADLTAQCCKKQQSCSPCCSPCCPTAPLTPGPVLSEISLNSTNIIENKSSKIISCQFSEKKSAHQGTTQMHEAEGLSCWEDRRGYCPFQHHEVGAHQHSHFMKFSHSWTDLLAKHSRKNRLKTPSEYVFG